MGPVTPADLTEAEARSLTEEIRVHVETAWDLIIAAYTGRAWVALGYETWDSYVSAEFSTNRFSLPREDRQGIFISLREAGLSTRAIGAATGSSRMTVARELATVTNGTVDRLPATVVSIDGRTRPARQAHVANNSGNNEWYTPAAIVEAARAVMGTIDVDPASCEVANEVVKAGTFYTADQDGLRRDWHGNVWLNPPYAAGLVDKFAAKLLDELAVAHVTQACVLVNNATETGWFQKLGHASTALCLLYRRVKFWHPGRQVATPLQGQVVLYFGGSVERFSEHFGELGRVVTTGPAIEREKKSRPRLNIIEQAEVDRPGERSWHDILAIVYADSSSGGIKHYSDAHVARRTCVHLVETIDVAADHGFLKVVDPQDRAAIIGELRRARSKLSTLIHALDAR